jgi:hypothetical protein
MLAVAILSVGLVSVLRSYATSLRAVRTSRNFLLAGLFLEEKIWQKQEQKIRSGGVIPNEEQGRFAAPFDAFSYKVSFEEEEDLSALYKTTFEIFWPEGQKEQSITSLTYISAKE